MPKINTTKSDPVIVMNGRVLTHKNASKLVKSGQARLGTAKDIGVAGLEILTFKDALIATQHLREALEAPQMEESPKPTQTAQPSRSVKAKKN